MFNVFVGLVDAYFVQEHDRALTTEDAQANPGEE
jgi:hypothetical protein